MGPMEDRLRKRVITWSDQLLESFPLVSREATLRGLEYAVGKHKLKPLAFAALCKEHPRELATLEEIMADAKLFCRIAASLPMLARLQGEDGDYPAAIRELLEIDDRLYPAITRTFLARNLDAPKWLAVTEQGSTDAKARDYVLELLDGARLSEVEQGGTAKSGWASRYFPREVGSGQTRATGSHKWTG